MGARRVPKLLVVDDDAAVRQVTQEMLAVLGYESESVPSGRMALNIIKDNHFDIMLLDVAMPTMTGAQVVAELEQLNLGLPVILMTGFSISDMAELLENPKSPRGLLSKPFPIKELQAAVEQMFAVAADSRSQ